MKRNKTLYIITHVVGFFIAMYLVFLANDIFHTHPTLVGALIFPVNHSLFEHAKLFFIPTTLVAIMEFLIIGKQYKNYLVAHNITTFFMPIVMMIAYSILYFVFPRLTQYEHVYTILGIIVLFIGWISSYIICSTKKRLFKYTGRSLLLLVALQMLFIVFTFVQPKNDYFFLCSIYDCYGIPVLP